MSMADRHAHAAAFYGAAHTGQRNSVPLGATQPSSRRPETGRRPAAGPAGQAGHRPRSTIPRHGQTPPAATAQAAQHAGEQAKLRPQRGADGRAQPHADRAGLSGEAAVRGKDQALATKASRRY